MLKFLNERGLLDFPATSQLSVNRPQVEQLVQLIDGIPLGYSPGNPEGDATISSSGEVMSLNFNPVKYEPVARLPILTAQQAWDQAINSQLINGMDMSEMRFSNPDLRSWYRQHPLDQRVELFGWISSFKAAEQGKPPMILLDGYPATGGTQGMESVEPSNAFAQVWGTFRADGQGGRGLEVEGWQLSPFPSESITGTIMLRGDASYVLTNGRLLRLPDPPADLPLDQPLFFNGVVLELPEPTLEWSSISNSVGGGGGGGGSLWPDVYLEGAANPLPTAEPTPVPPDLTGQRLEGFQGKPLVFIHQYTDGSTTVEVMFYLNPGQGLPQDDTYYLEGPGIAGIEAYHQLPVKVWGTISESKGYTHKVNVEKLEPVYPGVKVQVWMGKFDKVNLEGKDVMLFTSADGSQYVLGSSIDNSQVDYGVVPGDPVIVEGLLVPDQSLGGHSVVIDYNLNPASGMDDLEQYAAMTLQPVLIREPGKAGSRRIGTVTKIELAYYTDEPRNMLQQPGAPLPFIQPVWRFSGTYDDGATFELIVQALDPTYLKMP